MPVQRCQKSNKPGFKWGPNGKCYTGRDAHSRAVRQGRAIEASKQREKRIIRNGK